MQRRIRGFRQDAGEDWVAELECGHDQHIRHRPPFELRPWILSAAERTSRLGTARECPLCDAERGGEAACFAQLVCAECGAVAVGGSHRAGCSRPGDPSP
jgi:hypothetical protein